jgi:hypothetical protein
MKKLLWFNAIVTVLFLLAWLGLYGWWNFTASRPFLKQLPQVTIENAKAITDLDHLRKLTLLLIDKNQIEIAGINDVLEKSVTAIENLARVSFIFFLVNSVWLYRLLRVQPPGKSGDGSSRRMG